MSVNLLRVKNITNVTYNTGTVVYQMCRDIRAHDNDALLFAQELAKSSNSELIVNYVIWNYEWQGATRRFYDWVLPSLIEVEQELRKHSIPLVVTFKEKGVKNGKLPSHIGAVVIDQLPLHFMKAWKDDFVDHHGSTPLYEVDAHNCIPAWILSEKQEFAAHTLRRKVHAKIPEFLEEYGVLTNHVQNKNLVTSLPSVDWENVSSKIRCREDVVKVGSFIPGEKAAHDLLQKFITSKLETYEVDRNKINSDGQSNLSPYIAHGAISRRRILLEVLKHTKKTSGHGLRIEDIIDKEKNGSNGTLGSVASFVEECLVRAELSENFCYYSLAYDSYDGFPLWAKETLRKALTDIREYVYTRDQFERAETHDDLWNAAQMQMVTTGKMHGYMRMYWAKKILEWSATPEDAMRTAVYLNDVYELDGRDPNGYVGCAWSIGGVHDRPWFGRPIFGAIRYMAESGVAKRGKVKEYIEKWSTECSTLF